MNPTIALPYPTESDTRIRIAFGCAVALYLAAIFLARTHAVVVSGDAEGPFDDTVIGIIDTPPELPDAEQQQDAIIAEQTSDFTEEATTSRVPVRNRNIKPVVANLSHGQHVSDMPARFGSVKTLALSAPRPSYPYEARRRKIVGSGVALLTVDSPSGGVTNARMVQSTGSAILDNSTLSALRQWRFKAGTVTSVQVPISFTLTGASY